MVSVIFLQVVMRQFGASLSWSEELARYCFIWMTYMGISYGVKKHRHVKVDAILAILSKKGQIVLNIISNLFFAAFAIFIIVYGFDIATQLLAFGQKSAANQIPMGLIYMATPIGMSLTLIRITQNVYKLVLTFMGKADFKETSEAEQILESVN
jgi:TRAP-type C4-dicarboxylate transport system permease small subunit